MFPISPIPGHIRTCEDVERIKSPSLRSSIDMSKLNVSAEAFVPAVVPISTVAPTHTPWAQAHAVYKPKSWAAEPRRVIIVAQPGAVLEIERASVEFDLVFPWLRVTKCIPLTPPVCTDEVYTAIVYAAFIQHALKCENVPRSHICVISAHGGDYKTVSEWMHALGVNIHTMQADHDKINALKGKDIDALSHDELMQLRDIDVEKKTKLRYNPWLRVVEPI
jgi:hypothetical protein